MRRDQMIVLALCALGLVAVAALDFAPDLFSQAEDEATANAAVAPAPAPAPTPTPPSARPVPEGPHEVPDGALITTNTGLQYYDIVVGTGDPPTAGDTVKVDYAGWLTNGSMFDSSFKRADPYQFELRAGRVIKGWDEGVATMRVGGKRQLVIPPELAYGERRRSGIPPNSTLVFDIELHEIVPAESAAE